MRFQSIALTPISFQPRINSESKMATLEITTKIGCRNNCTYCPQDQLIAAFSRKSDRVFLERARSNGLLRMGFDVYTRCIDKVPVSVDIHFTGMCEPWLNPDCTQMLLYAHNKGHRIAASSTLVGMNIEDIDALAEVPFKIFWLHLPSADGLEAIHVDADYLKRLERILASPIAIRCHFHGRSLHPALKSLSDHVHRQRISNRSGNVQTGDGRHAVRRNPGRITCARNLRCNVLLPSGDVVLCCNDYGMQHVLGNLCSDDYADLHRGAPFQKVKRGLGDPSMEILCRYCDVDVVENRARIFDAETGAVHEQ
jgi:hypothetical protein